MILVFLFIIHWYVSLFFQTFLNHRYAAHSQFTMSPFWEKTFFLLSWLINGSSYLSPRAYGIMHRMHHAYADTEKDPHSPKYSKNLFTMMWDTRKVYSKVFSAQEPIEERFTKGVPDWPALDRIAENWWVRLLWGALYTVGFIVLHDAWWQFLLLPVVFVMGPTHGAIINWFAHRIGYRNFEVKDTSKNIMPVDIFMMGEGYHNNHHKHPSRANFGHRWHEVDPVYLIMRLFHFLGIIQLKERQKKQTKLQFDFSLKELSGIIKGFDALNLDAAGLKAHPEQKLKELLKGWDEFVKKDWSGKSVEYLDNILIREKLQVFLDKANSSLKEKISAAIAKSDQIFQKKMEPLTPKFKQQIEAITSNLGHFWQTHGLLT